jgi:hypothetical protein
MVAGALYYLHRSGALDANTIVATTLGVFFSVVFGWASSPPLSSAAKTGSTSK